MSLSDSTNGDWRILTESEAKEAVMNGAKVKLRNYPPYLFCPLCRGDGSNLWPFDMYCGGPHDSGWVIVNAT